MHDLDRRMFEATGFGGELEAERQEEQEFRELLGELVRGGGGRADELGLEMYETRGPGVFDDRSTREVALASELLEVQTAAEMEQFLGGLLRRLAGGGRKFARSATGRALGGVLKQAASQALPQLDEPAGCSGGHATQCPWRPGREVGRRAGSGARGAVAGGPRVRSRQGVRAVRRDGHPARDAGAGGDSAGRRRQSGGRQGRRTAPARPAGRPVRRRPTPARAQRSVGAAGQRNRRERRMTRSRRGSGHASAGQGAAG